MSRAVYVDSSALVAVLLGEPQERTVLRTLADFEQVFSANLLAAEVLAATTRESVPAARATPIIARVNWVLPNRSLEREILQALAHGYLRGADLWHVANALFLRESFAPLSFLTLDEPQLALAATLGLHAIAA